MKTFIFITASGSAYDYNDVEQQNCQHLITAEGETAQEAWDNCKNNISGYYKDITAFELVSDRQVFGSFELDNLPNIPAECEDFECNECPNSNEVKKEIDCPYI